MNTSINISLPESLANYINQRISEEHFNNPGDYICALIKEEQKRRDEEKLEAMLLKGLDSDSRVMNAQNWQSLKSGILSSLKNSSN